MEVHISCSCELETAQVHADCVLPLQVDCLRLLGEPRTLGQEGPRGLCLQVEQESCCKTSLS